MNLPISTNAPQPPAGNHAAAQTPDDQTTKAADPFGSVLARQLADKATASVDKTAIPADKTIGLAGHTPTTATQDLLDALSEEKKAKQPATAADGSNLPQPTDMLAALLAAPSALVAQAAAKPDASKATPTTATDNKLLQLDSSKQASKLLPGQADGAPLTGSKSDGKNFAAALHAAPAGQPDTAAALASKPAIPSPAEATPSPAAIPAQFIQANQFAAMVNTQLSVDTPVSSEHWGNDFTQKITWLATQHDQSAEMSLNPPDLGPLHVVLHVSGDQATAMFTSPHAAVRDAVEQAMPKLREMFADNGIMLGNATVSDQGQRDNQAGQPQGQQRTLSALSAGIGGVAGVSQGSKTLPVRRHNGLVDTFA